MPCSSRKRGTASGSSLCRCRSTARTARRQCLPAPARPAAAGSRAKNSSARSAASRRRRRSAGCRSPRNRRWYSRSASSISRLRGSEASSRMPSRSRGLAAWPGGSRGCRLRPSVARLRGPGAGGVRGCGSARAGAHGRAGGCPASRILTATCRRLYREPARAPRVTKVASAQKMSNDSSCRLFVDLRLGRVDVALPSAPGPRP